MHKIGASYNGTFVSLSRKDKKDMKKAFTRKSDPEFKGGVRALSKFYAKMAGPNWRNPMTAENKAFYRYHANKMQ